MFMLALRFLLTPCLPLFSLKTWARRLLKEETLFLHNNMRIGFFDTRNRVDLSHDEVGQ